MHTAMVESGANVSSCTRWCRTSDQRLNDDESTAQGCGALSLACSHGHASHSMVVTTRRRNRLRTALCLAGNARTFTRPHVHASITDKLVRSLNTTLDVFAAFSLEDDGLEVQYPGGARNSPVAAAASAVGPAFAVMQPRVLKLYTSISLSDINHRCALGKHLTIHVRKWMGQWHKISECFGLVMQAELHDRQQYEWVIRSRLDLFWFQPHPSIEQLVPRGASFAAFWHQYPRGDLGRGNAVLGMDMHFAVPRQSAASIFRLYDRYLACEGPQLPFHDNRFASEGTLLNAFNELGEVRPLGVSFVIVRKENTAHSEALPMCRDRLRQEEMSVRLRVDGDQPRPPCSNVYSLAYPKAVRMRRRLLRRL